MTFLGQAVEAYFTYISCKPEPTGAFWFRKRRLSVLVDWGEDIVPCLRRHLRDWEQPRRQRQTLQILQHLESDAEAAVPEVLRFANCDSQNQLSLDAVAATLACIGRNRVGELCARLGRTRSLSLRPVLLDALGLMESDGSSSALRVAWMLRRGNTSVCAGKALTRMGSVGHRVLRSMEETTPSSTWYRWRFPVQPGGYGHAG